MGNSSRIPPRPKKKELPNTRTVEVTGTFENSIPSDRVYEEEALSSETTDDLETLQALETHAHVHRTLISSDALRFITQKFETRTEQMNALDLIIDHAQKQYPSENDWIVLNRERVETLLSLET